MRINNPTSSPNYVDSDIEASEMEWGGNVMKATFNVEAGEYIMRVRGEWGPDHGSITWLIDERNITFLQSWESPIHTLRVVKTFKVNIPTSGRHVLKAVFSKKCTVNRVWFKPV